MEHLSMHGTSGYVTYSYCCYLAHYYTLTKLNLKLQFCASFSLLLCLLDGSYEPVF